MMKKKIFLLLPVLLSLTGCHQDKSESILSFRQYAYQVGKGLIKDQLLKETLVSYPYGTELSYDDSSLTWLSASNEDKKLIGPYLSIKNQTDKTLFKKGCVEKIKLSSKTTTLSFGLVFKTTGEDVILEPSFIR